jgi:serine protease
MSNNRWSLAALALAPILALAACDQVSSIWERVRGGETAAAPGPAALDSVSLDARAISGSLQPQDQIATLLAPEPVMIAPGEILVGAQVEDQLAQAAATLGLTNNLMRSLRSGGFNALSALPDDVETQVLAQAEQVATTQASAAARDVLGRLGISGEIQVQEGGVVKVDLAPTASPTKLRFAQEGAGAEATPDAQPASVEWNAADRCPRVVTEGALEADLSLATKCAIQRLQASNQFEYVEPNYIASNVFSLPPARTPAQPKQTPPPAPPAQQQNSSGAQSQPTSSPAPAPPTAPSTTAETPAPEEEGGIPNDPLEALQWHYRDAGTGPGQSPGGAGFEAFWRAHQVGARSVRVAVIDTGIDLTHPDIAHSPNVAPGIDLISNPERAGDGDGIDADAQDAGDICGTARENSYHGTHVAGTIGAGVTNDRVGVAGGDWDVTVVPVRVLGRCGGELADIVSGIRWAAGVASAPGPNGTQIVNRNPADIINMSLTIQAPCPASMQAAIDAAVGRGAVIVVAAGNKAQQARLYAPANCNNVIVVAANDGRGRLAFYSNFGPEVDVMAPGGDVYADSDNDGKPDGVLSTRTTQFGCYDPLNQNSTARCYYSFLQGTSMAAPHVSAALALLAAQTGLRGQRLQDAFITRAMSPIDAGRCEIECARNRNATPIQGDATLCMRPCGAGMLDMARAATTIEAAQPASP